ncbi:MAG: methionyl-tRNA formyltransferase [Gemmatimonadota bacterium]|nr:methionyl-tRNA formyltransferase [Gemmatimonadota bacterium]
MRILFFGTPEFATPALRALIGEGHEVVGVVTQPDRPRGRSRSRLLPSPVKAVALEEGIPVFQPERPRGDEFLDALRALEPDISVVVAYGHILTQELIDLPRLGTLNIHASLLPRWRGAAPIQATLLAGDRETGVSIMRMVLGLDAGPVLHEVRTEIPADETAGELTERLAELGAFAIVEALALLDLGGVEERAQDESQVTYAPKIERAQARLDFTQPAELVAREIRAYDPKPGAWGVVRDGEVRLFGVRVLPDRRGDPGEVLAVGEMGMIVACGTGAVAVETVHPAGKRRLAALDWAQGRGVAQGDHWAPPG